jgi:hypothetical protein
MDQWLDPPPRRDGSQVEDGSTVKLRVDKSSRLEELMDAYEEHQSCDLILQYKASSAERFALEETSLLGKAFAALDAQTLYVAPSHLVSTDSGYRPKCGESGARPIPPIADVDADQATWCRIQERSGLEQELNPPPPIPGMLREEAVRPAAALLADNVVIELGMQDLRSNSRKQILDKFARHDIPIDRLLAEEGPRGPFILPQGSRIAQVRVSGWIQHRMSSVALWRRGLPYIEVGGR